MAALSMHAVPGRIMIGDQHTEKKNFLASFSQFGRIYIQFIVAFLPLDAEWEVCRLRWMKVAILHAVLPRVIQSLISEAGGMPVHDPDLVRDIRNPVAAFVAGDPEARQQLETLLEGHLLTLDLVIAAAFDDRIVSQLHIDRMTTTAWERRIAAYAELNRLRTISGKPDAPRDKTLEIEPGGHPTAPIVDGDGHST